MTVNTDKNENPKNSMEQLEDALLICKFGKFHIRLLLATLAATCATTMVTTTSSYILSSAECDLDMTIMQKGLLNAMPFFGQVGAALFTGFVIDSFGRKMFLVGGNLGIFLCTIFEGFSQNYWMLICGKLIEGIFMSFSFSATTTMVSEFTPKNVRDRVLLITFSFMSSSLIITALMSWGLLPQLWVFKFSEHFVLHSWNIYLFVCSVWSLIAGVLYYYLPESPKWLLSHGQDDKALEVLKNIYSENTGNDQSTFPVKSITMEGTTPIPTNASGMKKQLINGLYEAKDLFRLPLLWQLLLFSSTTFVSLLAYSAMRLWYPQLSTIIETYKNYHETTETFCVMINDYDTHIIENSTSAVTNVTIPEICVPHLSGTETYVNSIIMGLVSLVCILTSTYLVGIVGQKPLIFITFVLSGLCSGALYWTYTSIQIALLVSFTCAFVQTALSLQQNIIVRVFPTTVRSLAFSFVIMSGRVGSLVGNILFPVLLQVGCMGPFISLTAVTWSVASLVYFLPDPRKDNAAGDK